MNKHDFFDIIMTKCAWSKQGNDEKVLAPLIKFLSQQEDDEIFMFEDIMTDLLYQLDTLQNFKIAKKYYHHNADTFLYSCCVALINGEKYYINVKQGKNKDLWTKEFESLLYVPKRAWKMKHHKSLEYYPHLPAISYETGSNKDGWEKRISLTRLKRIIQNKSIKNFM